MRAVFLKFLKEILAKRAGVYWVMNPILPA